MKFDTGFVKWVTGLDTDAKRIFALMLSAIMILGIVVGYLFVRLDTIGKDKDEYWEAIVAKKDSAHASLLAIEVTKKEEAQQATKDAMREQFELMTSLWKEQKEHNERSEKVDKTQLSIANNVHKKIIGAKKEANELVKIIDQQK